jgi:hypothetical protein
MIARNTNVAEMEQALLDINLLFDNNVKWEYITIGRSNIKFRLRVKDSRKKGARRGHTGRRLINACWHVHGEFFDALFKINPNATIQAAGTGIITNNSGNWIDRNIGSMMYPLYYSEACECE